MYQLLESFMQIKTLEKFLNHRMTSNSNNQPSNDSVSGKPRKGNIVTGRWIYRSFTLCNRWWIFRITRLSKVLHKLPDSCIVTNSKTQESVRVSTYKLLIKNRICSFAKWCTQEFALGLKITSINRNDIHTNLIGQKSPTQHWHDRSFRTMWFDHSNNGNIQI